MNEKIDLTNDQFDIIKYGLKGEDIYNIAKFGQNIVDNNVRIAAKQLLIDAIHDKNRSEESQFFAIMLMRLLVADKRMDDYRSNLIKTIDMIIKDYGIFSLKAYIEASKIADAAEKTSN